MAPRVGRDADYGDGVEKNVSRVRELIREGRRKNDVTDASAAACGTPAAVPVL